MINIYILLSKLSKWSIWESNPCPKILLTYTLLHSSLGLCLTTSKIEMVSSLWRLSDLAPTSLKHLLFLRESGIQHEAELFEPQLAYLLD